VWYEWIQTRSKMHRWDLFAEERHFSLFRAPFLEFQAILERPRNDNNIPHQSRRTIERFENSKRRFPSTCKEKRPCFSVDSPFLDYKYLTKRRDSDRRSSSPLSSVGNTKAQTMYQCCEPVSKLESGTCCRVLHLNREEVTVQDIGS
jgi:hypothetical protein